MGPPQSRARGSGAAVASSQRPGAANIKRCRVAAELGAHCHRPTRPHNMGLLFTSVLQGEGRGLAGVARGRG